MVWRAESGEGSLEWREEFRVEKAVESGVESSVGNRVRSNGEWHAVGSGVK